MTLSVCRRAVSAVPHLIALPLLLAGCSAADDTRAVRANEVVEWTLEELGRIGSEHDPETSFTMLGGVRIGPEGELFVGPADG